MRKLLWQLLGAGASGGLFNPGGNQSLFNAVSRDTLSNNQAATQAARTQAQLAGGDDPSLGAYGALQAQLGGSRNTSQALNQARIASLQQAQSLFEEILKLALPEGIQR